MSEFGAEDFSVGDWVAFMRDSRIVVAEVRYKTVSATGYSKLQTDAGEVSPSAVLEIRKRHAPRQGADIKERER